LKLFYLSEDVIDNPEMQKKYKADTGKELKVPTTWKEYGEMAKYFNGWDWDGDGEKEYGFDY
jgi:multiple sugar transport system substrate-binding protein